MIEKRKQNTPTEKPDSRWSLLKRQYFFFFVCFANIISNTQKNKIRINPGHFMHTAECTIEYSAFEYYKQQKHCGYMIIQEKKANNCCNTPEDANSILHGQN